MVWYGTRLGFTRKKIGFVGAFIVCLCVYFRILIKCFLFKNYQLQTMKHFEVAINSIKYSLSRMFGYYYMENFQTL